MFQAAVNRAGIRRVILAVAGLAFVLTATAATPQQAAGAAQCDPGAALVKVPELPEASGIAISRRAGRLWTHNDSGEPVLFALDTRGVVTARLRVSGAKVEDWEAIAVGPCAAGSCIYVADIGDNDAERKQITIYRVAEPAGNETTAVSEVFHANYPDGPHDAETLLVTPKGELFIVTKGDTGPVALYRFPRELRSGDAMKLERVGQPRGSGQPEKDDRITDGSVSPDGGWIVLRTNGALIFHRATELMAGKWEGTRRVDLEKLGEPQGEGVAFGSDHTLFILGEGGGKSQPGTFARLACKAVLR